MAGNIFLAVFIIGGGIGLYSCYRYIYTTANKKNRNASGWMWLTIFMPFILAPIIAVIVAKLPPLPPKYYTGTGGKSFLQSVGDIGFWNIWKKKNKTGS
jgi:predicted permease